MGMKIRCPGKTIRNASRLIFTNSDGVASYLADMLSSVSDKSTTCSTVPSGARGFGFPPADIATSFSGEDNFSDVSAFEKGKLEVMKNTQSRRKCNENKSGMKIKFPFINALLRLIFAKSHNLLTLVSSGCKTYNSYPLHVGGTWCIDKPVAKLPPLFYIRIQN